ncbi:hypothetical protein [Streptomyces sp. G-G2]|uniref:hypothetical protein n=1 Tax=Streptomyces sp. G-G2 TaxID=3046201 RepID=UPI0024BA2EEF|nr:hypothetical protein [Streptomyces sp. G-G2]MDJ0385312.1 hypothetical protein [Streptomyces sp. G-G2]
MGFLEQSEARIELATALTEPTEACTAAGDPGRSRALFQRACELAVQSEAVLLLRRVDACVRREPAEPAEPTVTR